MSFQAKSSFSTHYVKGDKRTALYAHLCSVSNLENRSQESRQQRLLWEHQVDVLLNKAQDTRLNLPRFRFENDISIPNQITVFQNDEVKRIIIVVHGCYNIMLQRELRNNTLALDGAIIKLSEEKRYLTFEKTVNQIEDIMVDRSKLYPNHTYTFLGHSFGATQLYYAILRSNHIARNVASTHLFNPVTKPLIGLTFRRKIHPDVMRRINIHKIPRDTLSDGIQYLFGIRQVYQGYGNHRSNSKWFLQPCNVKSAQATSRVTWSYNNNNSDFVVNHDISNFY